MARLHTKILLSLSLIAAVYFTASRWIQRTALLPSFAHLEHEGAYADLGRAREAIDKEIVHVDNFVNDWSGWDDTYQYMADANEAYYKSNLENDVFRRDSFDFLVFVRADGTEVWRGSKIGDETIEVDELPHQWPADHPLLAPKGPEDSTRGVLLTSRGPMLMASRIVTDSARQAPARGWIMMGRFFDAERIRELADLVHLDLTIAPAPAVTDPEDLASLSKLGLAGFDGIEQRGDDRMAGVAMVPALDGAPGLFVRIDVPRTILAQGQTALGYAEVSMLVAVLVLFGGVLFTLRRMVVRPIAELTEHALEIRRSDDLTLRCGSARSDEIGMLAREFDHMVGELAESRRDSIARARAGGKSEIATEVLHDVGNTMQGMRTAASVLAASLHGRTFADAQRLQELMRPHAADLGRWFREDPKGRKAPAFVAALLEAVQRERDAMQEQVAAMTDALAHVEALLDRQRQHAGHAGVEESVAVEDLFAEAQALANLRAPITVTTTGTLDAVVKVERHRLVAVLVNMLRNAEEAMPSDHPGHVELAAELAADGGLCLSVRDDGAGIAAADLTRIFARGYSTKPRGSGVGLHTCATTLAEIGGTIRAESGGLGLGSRFVVDLPAARVVTAEVCA